uniref:aralkylamine N-acetyltransferase n=3 Tax=Culex pipiens TaxID=7175 RepID=A0A8D8FXE4_CULPI
MQNSNLNKVRLVTITSEYYDDVIEHLRRTFFADEPLNKATNLTRPGLGHPLLEKHSFSTLRDSVSVMAITSDGEIAGVALNGILYGHCDIKHSMDKLNDVTDENFKKIFKLLYEENLKINLFKQFEVDKIFEIRILSVDSKFRGQGLAKKLMNESENIAIENGFQVMKTDATGAFSQRVSQNLGFVTEREIKYIDYLDDQGKPIFIVDPPHDKLKIMYKLLN